MEETFDIVVIGAGSAGCAVAGRLAEDSRLKVCLIEAGGENTSATVTTPGLLAINMRKGKHNWGFDTVPQDGLGGRAGYQPRGKGLGGSSAINAMLYLRGNPWDYDNWHALGCTGWAWADVLPWFRKSEANERGADSWHGSDGPLSVSDQHWPNPMSTCFLAASESLQLGSNPDFNGPHQEGFGFYQVTQRGGERWSAARAFLTERPNLARRTGVLVERIDIEQGRAVGVTCRVAGITRSIRARAGVMLSAGVFGSPQLLMLSGIGPGQHLSDLGLPIIADRREVGEGLQDHVDYVGGWSTTAPEPIGFNFPGLWTMFHAWRDYSKHRSGMMTSPMAEAGGFWHSHPSVPAPDVQFHFVPGLLEDHGRKLVWGYGVSCHACVLRPESRGTVRLASPAPRAAPLIDPAFLSHPEDIAVLRAGVRQMRRIMASPAFAPYALHDRYPVDDSDDDALDRLIRSRADTIYHPVGTCRMGSDAEAVVDPKLQLRGVDRLWVADASIMPRLVSGNTNAPSIMIGERGADFVRQALNS